jgi:hypothetical protein
MLALSIKYVVYILNTIYFNSKFKPYAEDEPQQPKQASTTQKDEPSLVEEKKLEMKLSKQSVDKQWNLLGRYLGQYIVYTGQSNAWLLS